MLRTVAGKPVPDFGLPKRMSSIGDHESNVTKSVDVAMRGEPLTDLAEESAGPSTST